MVNLKKLVVDEFDSKEAQEAYVKFAEDGLWRPEEILVKKYFKPKSKVLDVGCVRNEI